MLSVRGCVKCVERAGGGLNVLADEAVRAYELEVLGVRPAAGQVCVMGDVNTPASALGRTTFLRLPELLDAPETLDVVGMRVMRVRRPRRGGPPHGGMR
ncbi:hypothetical protein ACW4TU_26260 [Streptomyces sp. QTS52]